MTANSKMLEDLFLDTLKDIYYAEKQILRALPKMAKAADLNDLRQAFEAHRDQTQTHVERLDQVFELLGRRSQGKTCEAIQGIIEEGKSIMEEYADSEALDAGLISSAQAVEHYEITRYGTLKKWAEELGHDEAMALLDQTLQEERQTDELLTRIAEQSANARAQDKEDENQAKETEAEASESAPRRSARTGGRAGTGR
ncbi:MAG: ferritin-like domain-containing protein [Methylobacteriaceae bacterium]|nr:ferritin-like domain-containing protein [Methylobacteriaceae bacterium]